MSTENKLRDSFSEITPPTDNVTLVRNVIERAENMNNNENRKPRLNMAAVTIIAAAAVLAAATVSVGAATGWSFNSAFSQANQVVAERHGNTIVTAYSTAEAWNGSENTLSTITGAPFDWQSGGKELDLWYSFDNFRLNIKGICADDFAASVLYDVVFDNESDCPSKYGWTDWGITVVPEAVDKALKEQPELGMVTSVSDGVISKEGNILHCYTMPMLSPEYTWEKKTLTLDFKSNKKEFFIGADGLHVEIPIDFPTFERRICEIDEPLNLSMNENNRIMYGDDVIGNVKYFGATPLSWRVYVEADTSKTEDGIGYYYLDLAFEASGISVERISGMGYIFSNDNGEGEVGLFNQPIDPADITSVTICGQTYELK